MRMILMIVLPVVMVQFVVLVIFYGNLWDIVLRRLSRAVASEVSIVVRHHRYFRNIKDRDWSIETVSNETGYDIEFHRNEKIPKTKPETRFGYHTLDYNLRMQLKELLGDEFYVNIGELPGIAVIDVQVDDGYIQFRVPISRLYTSSSWLVLAWMSGSSVIFLFISGLFLRNQIRPIRKLALAARQFGEDKPDEYLPEAGSSEIREATRAFMVMRQDIRRNVRERTEMLSAASHDLRTPLTRMKLNLELLDLGGAGEGLKQDIADMERLISAYLDFLRGAGDEPLTTVNLDEFLAEIVQNAQRSGLITQLNPDFTNQNEKSSATPLVLLRKLAFKRVFDNLISNSVRHATEISLSYKWMDDKWLIYFDDNGPGIPPNYAIKPSSHFLVSRIRGITKLAAMAWGWPWCEMSSKIITVMSFCKNRPWAVCASKSPYRKKV